MTQKDTLKGHDDADFVSRIKPEVNIRINLYDQFRCRMWANLYVLQLYQNLKLNWLKMKRIRTMQEKRAMVQRFRKAKPFHYLMYFFLSFILIGVSIRIFNFYAINLILALIFLLFGALCFFLVFKAKNFYKKIYYHERSNHPKHKEFG